MTRTLLVYIMPIFVWGSLGLWGLVFRAVVLPHGEPLPLTRSLAFQAIVYGPISFLINWRTVSRRHATQARKYKVSVEDGDSAPEDS